MEFYDPSHDQDAEDPRGDAAMEWPAQESGQSPAPSAAESVAPAAFLSKAGDDPGAAWPTGPGPASSGTLSDGQSSFSLPKQAAPSPQTTSDWFARLSQIHQQMLNAQYGRESYRQEIEHFGQAVSRLQQEMAKISDSNQVLTQYQDLLANVQSKVADHEKMLLDQMTQHENALLEKMQAHSRGIEEKLQRMGNPLSKLDALLEEQSAGFRVFASLSKNAVWIIGGSVFVGTVIGNLVAVFAGF